MYPFRCYDCPMFCEGEAGDYCNLYHDHIPEGVAFRGRASFCEVKKPTFAKEKYVDYLMPNGDRDVDIRNRHSKLVMVRKEHRCASCGTKIREWEKALRETCFLDGKPASCYYCLWCVEEAMDDPAKHYDAWCARLEKARKERENDNQ